MVVRALILLAALAVLALCPPPPAQARSVTEIARALRTESPVYANPAARPTLARAEVGRVAIEIAKRDTGRIKVVVASKREVAAAGGVAALANGVDKRLDVRGTVLVNAGSRSWLVTDFADTQAATSAVQQAFESHRRLVDQLVEAVDGIASIDPGPSAPEIHIPPVRIPRFPRIPSPGAGSSGGGLSSAATIAIVTATAVPFLIWGLIVLRRSWRARREAHETFEDDLADARQQLVALGDDIGELDLDVEMPNADAAGKQAYEQALDQYQRAERLLDEEPSPRRLARANVALAEGRRLMDSARSRLEHPG